MTFVGHQALLDLIIMQMDKHASIKVNEKGKAQIIDNILRLENKQVAYMRDLRALG